MCAGIFTQKRTTGENQEKIQCWKLIWMQLFSQMFSAQNNFEVAVGCFVFETFECRKNLKIQHPPQFKIVYFFNCWLFYLWPPPPFLNSFHFLWLFFGAYSLRLIEATSLSLLCWGCLIEAQLVWFPKIEATKKLKLKKTSKMKMSSKIKMTLTMNMTFKWRHAMLKDVSCNT